MTHGFKVVAVRVKDEARVVVLVVVGAQPGSAMVGRSERNGSRIESIDLGPCVEAKRDVDRLNDRIAPDERENCVRPCAKADRDVAEVSIHWEAEGSEELLVERTAVEEVGDHQVEVIEFDHGPVAAV